MSYYIDALRWLCYIWGGSLLASFVLYFVLCAVSGAGEGSGEEDDQ